MKKIVTLGAFALLLLGVFGVYRFGKQASTHEGEGKNNTGREIQNEEVRMNSGTRVSSQGKTYTAEPAMSIKNDGRYVAMMQTSKGKMKILLYPADAPHAVNNFIFLAKEGFYTNTTFHRIIQGFMIQGGDPKGNGMGGPGYRFADEPITRSYTRGTLAMANAGPNTNGSQFFIMHADYALPKQYVIFGGIDPKDEESLRTLDAIATTRTTMSETGEQSKPVEPVTVESISIEEE